MDKFFKSLKYYSVQLFANILIGIAYIVLSFHLWSYIFFGYLPENPFISTILINILALVIGVIGAKIRDNNEEYKNKKD